MNFTTALPKTLALATALLTLPIAVLAYDIGSTDPEVLKELYPGATYSPYAQRSFPSKVYWGETHLHTGLSLDAGLFGNTTGHDTAYRLARGEQVTSSTGQPLKLSRPLDFLVITDHSDMMGIATDIQREDRKIDIRLRADEDFRNSTEDLRNLTVHQEGRRPWQQ